MPRHVSILFLFIGGLTIAGCARFSTSQADLNYGPDGKPLRKITTRATAYTFGTSKSQLANFKASQTDKTQGATVGSLTQESNASNAVHIVQAVTEAAIRATLKP